MALETGYKVVIHNLIEGRFFVVEDMLKYEGECTIVVDKAWERGYYRLSVDGSRFIWSEQNLKIIAKIDSSYPKHFKPIKGYDCYTNN